MYAFDGLGQIFREPEQQPPLLVTPPPGVVIQPPSEPEPKRLSASDKIAIAGIVLGVAFLGLEVYQLSRKR